MRFVQPGVLRCNAPRFDSPGFVQLTILKNGENVTAAPGHASLQFEYRGQFLKKSRAMQKTKAGRIEDRPRIEDLISGGDCNRDTFKVRVVERLNFMNSQCKGCSHRESHSEALNPKLDDLCAAVKSTLSHLQASFSREETALWLNTADDDGVALIHYAAALDLTSAVEQLGLHGADMNLKISGTNLSPFVIASALGLDHTITALLSRGAQLLTSQTSESILRKAVTPKAVAKGRSLFAHPLRDFGADASEIKGTRACKQRDNYSQVASEGLCEFESRSEVSMN